MAEQQLSHHTLAPVWRKSHGNAAPAFISQLQGAPGGLQPGQATGSAGRTRSSERPARTRLCRSVVTSWPPCPRRHSVEPPLTPPSAAMLLPCCRHITRNMILSQPGAWSAVPSGLRSAPWNSSSMVPRVIPLVLGRARRSGRGSTGGADHIRSSLSVVQMDAAPVSTAAVASSRPREHPEGPPSAWSVVQGGCYIKNE